MKPSRRSFLRLVGIGTGAVIAAPVLARIPETTLTLPPVEPLAAIAEISDDRVVNWEEIINPPEQFLPNEYSNPYLITKADLGLCSKGQLLRVVR
jgi:hypothetical protein